MEVSAFPKSSLVRHNLPEYKLLAIRLSQEVEEGSWYSCLLTWMSQSLCETLPGETQASEYKLLAIRLSQEVAEEN